MMMMMMMMMMMNNNNNNKKTNLFLVSHSAIALCLFIRNGDYYCCFSRSTCCLKCDTSTTIAAADVVIV
jgi:hypothetical protein